MVARVDPISAKRIHPRDEKRLVRALEVFFLTKRSLTSHFNDTRSLIASYDVVPFGLRLDASTIAIRVKERVTRQFDQGLLNEVRELLLRGIPEDVHPFSGLVYRQVLEYLHGVRNEEETRALIVKENQKYARRQLIWFRKEPNLHWIDMPGESSEALQEILRLITKGQ
jgi:tRNA dimethylallyltransferase